MVSWQLSWACLRVTLVLPVLCQRVFWWLSWAELLQTPVLHSGACQRVSWLLELPLPSGGPVAERTPPLQAVPGLLQQGCHWQLPQGLRPSLPGGAFPLSEEEYSQPPTCLH